MTYTPELEAIIERVKKGEKILLFASATHVNDELVTTIHVVDFDAVLKLHRDRTIESFLDVVRTVIKHN